MWNMKFVRDCMIKKTGLIGRMTRLTRIIKKLKLVKQGNDVDWLAIPVRELGVGHKHSIIAEGGNESFRYALDLSYSNKIGVMKGSKRDTYGVGNTTSV